MATAKGGGLYATTTSAYYIGENNIIYYNRATNNPDIYGNVTFNYSCCPNPLTGAGNITAEPLFVDPYSFDFHLQEDSPCIDAGDPNNPLDPDGTIADMGALYYDQGHPEIALSTNLLQFDDTIVGESDTEFFTIYNVGTANLLIQGMVNNLTDVFAVNWNPVDSVIVPGDSLVVEVMFTPIEVTFYEDDLSIENSASLVYVHLEGEGIPPTGVGNQNRSTPLAYELHPAYPNPFNPTTTIWYSLPTASRVDIAVYDVSGCRIVTLVDGWRSAGQYEVTFEATGLAAGLYIYRLTAGDFTSSSKIVLLK